MPTTPSTPRRVLLFAYYFPPMGLSGVQRVAKLAKYLPRHGWQPVVVTARPGGYFAFDEELLDEVERAGVEVRRTPSIDPTRLFGGGATVALPSEGRRRLLTLASQLVFVPDNKLGWLPFAVREGLRVTRERPVDAVLSSAPPYTSHLAAALVARLARLPLVVDYRDDWTGNPRHTYPTPLHRRLNLALERAVLRRADGVTTINLQIARALDERAGRRVAAVLPQGFDPADFDPADFDPSRAAPETGATFDLVYAGVFYDAQKPDVFLTGLARFLERTPAARAAARARFLGLFPEAAQTLLDALGLRDVVDLAGYRSHRETARALQSAAVLWMTIGDRPGAEGISTSKLFEYMGTRRPILALVPEGAAREALAPYGAATVVPPDDPGAVAAALGRLWSAWVDGRLPSGDAEYVAGFDRERLAGVMAAHLDRARRAS